MPTRSGVWDWMRNRCWSFKNYKNRIKVPSSCCDVKKPVVLIMVVVVLPLLLLPLLLVLVATTKSRYKQSSSPLLVANIKSCDGVLMH